MTSTVFLVALSLVTGDLSTRRSPIVQVVDKVSPAVVYVGTVFDPPDRAPQMPPAQTSRPQQWESAPQRLPSKAQQLSEPSSSVPLSAQTRAVSAATHWPSSQQGSPALRYHDCAAASPFPRASPIAIAPAAASRRTLVRRDVVPARRRVSESNRCSSTTVPLHQNCTDEGSLALHGIARRA